MARQEPRARQEPLAQPVRTWLARARTRSHRGSAGAKRKPQVRVLIRRWSRSGTASQPEGARSIWFPELKAHVPRLGSFLAGIQRATLDQRLAWYGTEGFLAQFPKLLPQMLISSFALTEPTADDLALFLRMVCSDVPRLNAACRLALSVRDLRRWEFRSLTPRAVEEATAVRP